MVKSAEQWDELNQIRLFLIDQQEEIVLSSTAVAYLKK